MTARGTANMMTRVTAILAACFFALAGDLGDHAAAGATPRRFVDEVINETLFRQAGRLSRTKEHGR